jgi:leucyl aminopeptidase
MNIKISTKKLKEIKADLELIFVVNNVLEHRWVIDKEMLDKSNFKGEKDEHLMLIEKNRLYVGVDSVAHDDIRIACAEAVRLVSAKNFKSIKLGVYFEKSASVGIQAIVEGVILGEYVFSKYKSKHKKSMLRDVLIANEDYQNHKINLREAETALLEAQIIANNVNFVRDIVNQTPEDVTPLTMSKIAKKMAKNSGLKVKVFGEKYIKDQGMGAFYGVSKASPYPPQLIHLIHKPRKAKLKIALVGKGLTYDTGGLSLKPSDSMLTMKMDKAGACAVFGILKAAAELKLPIEIHGIVGAVENSIGKHAYKPDDVLVARNGKTIEIINTDAEGRLVLADCLCYAEDLKPDYIIDVATLTGACIVALGEYTIGLMGYSESLKTSFKKSADRSGELVGDLPFNRYLPKLIKSQIADITNVGSTRWGGAITAALFLSEFIRKENKNKWIHLDIAGPAFASKAWGENPPGASGAGVRLIIDWLKSIANKGKT